MTTRTTTSLIARYMRLCKFKGWSSFWRTIYVLPGHERDGRLPFSIKYMWWLCRYGYWNNPYEVEARAAENKLE